MLDAYGRFRASVQYVFWNRLKQTKGAKLWRHVDCGSNALILITPTKQKVDFQ